MPSAELLGFIAGGLITSSFIPQVIRVYKLKSAHEISLLFTCLVLLGALFWLSYGIIFHLRPIMFWNLIGVSLIAMLLIGKLKWGMR
ncbi:MAG: SemiSWEET family transporter [Chloroflexota bacterium]